MARWNIRYGKYWMVQWCFNGWVSLGVHIDFNCRTAEKTKERYGPYVDFHVGPAIFSLGLRPYYSTVMAANLVGRGGAITDGDTR